MQYKYSYGKKKSDKEKKAHALDGIYTKLVDLGNNELMPQIVAPAEELHLLPAIGNSMNNHANEERFDRIDRNYQELKTMVQRALNGLPQLNAPVSGSDKSGGIPPSVKTRLNSARKRSVTEIDSASETELDNILYSVTRDNKRQRNIFFTFKTFIY